MSTSSKNTGTMNTGTDTRTSAAPDVRDVTFRRARRADSHAIARLFQIASEGVSDYVWSLMADAYPGMPVIEIGARRYAREGVDFSYENTLVAEHGGPDGKQVIGMMLSYVVPPRPANENTPPQNLANDNTARPMAGVAAENADPVLQPLGELKCAGSLYISGLALHADWRGRGLGTRFLAAARRRAMETGLDKMSLIAFEKNPGAVRLYRREGFRITDWRELVRHPMIHVDGGKAFLMVRGAA